MRRYNTHRAVVQHDRDGRAAITVSSARDGSVGLGVNDAKARLHAQGAWPRHGEGLVSSIDGLVVTGQADHSGIWTYTCLFQQGRNICDKGVEIFQPVENFDCICSNCKQYALCYGRGPVSRGFHFVVHSAT